MTGQLDLLLPTLGGRHTEMSDGNLQRRTLCDDLLHLTHLHIAIRQIYREDHAVVFHQMEHLHHLWCGHQDTTVGQQQSVSRYLDGLKPTVDQRLCLCGKTRMEIVTHTTHEEAVGVQALHLFQIVILYAVDKLLCHHSGRHLGIVHIRKEHLGGVLAINHKRR